MKRQLAATKEAKPRFQFVRDIVAELKKVAWPSREDAARLTVIVLVVTAAMAVALGGLDWVFAKFTDTVLIK
ncbi:MAG: preprotein translocase subunit SecE [Dehalococcoidia bacterium]|nr:preprotein translocase subunit SecE [Dehalococcoidia bacterium]